MLRSHKACAPRVIAHDSAELVAPRATLRDAAILRTKEPRSRPFAPSTYTNCAGKGVLEALVCVGGILCQFLPTVPAFSLTAALPFPSLPC